LIAGCVALLVAVAGASAAAPAASEKNWSRSVERPIHAEQLGLPAGASPRRLGAAAIRRSARLLAGGRRLGDVRFDREVLRGDRRASAKPMRGLRFQQSLGGLRVLWSELDVTVTGDTVQSINATVVPLRSRRLTGQRRVDVRRARTIARRAVADPGVVRRPELVAYAGEPGKPRAPRRAYVVEVYEAAPQDPHSETAWCVVVDAEAGRVLQKWRGFAARPPTPADDARQRSNGVARHEARAAATKIVLLQYVDAGGQDVIVSPNYRDVWTDRTPFSFSGWHPLAYFRTFDTFGSVTDTALKPIGHVYSVARYVCIYQEFCGRDSGRDGSYNRHFVTANWGGDSYAKYQHSTERIFLSRAVGDNDDMRAIAHEFGHQIDLRNRNDYLSTTEGEEVEEALADMFSYDFERNKRDGFPTKPSIKRVLANPGGFQIDGVTLPAHQTDYNCTAGLDEHINGNILGHAYYLLVERIEHARAGAILKFVPWRLPAQRTFGQVRVAFANIAAELFGASARADVNAAFDAVGVTDNSSRTTAC
jgi:hypothetical protein